MVVTRGTGAWLPTLQVTTSDMASRAGRSPIRIGCFGRWGGANALGHGGASVRAVDPLWRCAGDIPKRARRETAADKQGYRVASESRRYDGVASLIVLFEVRIGEKDLWQLCVREITDGRLGRPHVRSQCPQGLIGSQYLVVRQARTSA